MLRLIPNTLFMRLFLLLAITLSVSHVLGIMLVSNVRDAVGFRESIGMREPRGMPPAAYLPRETAPHASADAGPPPVAPPPPRRLHRPPGILLLDLVVRLATLLLVSWIGARWLSAPIKRMADAANAFGKNIDAPALEEIGTVEVKQATHAINEMRERLRRQIQERSAFLAAISHDLRTPLTRMQLRAEAITPEPLQEKFRGDIAEMSSMLTAALDYLRGHIDSESTAMTDITSMLQAMAEDLQEQGQQVQVTGDVAPLRVKPMAIRRCLGNLIQNALNYGDRADISLTSSADEVVIEIRDAGPGIDPKRLGDVFQPFYRLEGSRNRATGGVGLGLTIARDIARAHGGELDLRNAKPKGLIARLVLPRSQESA